MGRTGMGAESNTAAARRTTAGPLKPPPPPPPPPPATATRHRHPPAWGRPPLSRTSGAGAGLPGGEIPGRRATGGLPPRTAAPPLAAVAAPTDQRRHHGGRAMTMADDDPWADLPAVEEGPAPRRGGRRPPLARSRPG